jgi:hypothetical protein
MVHSGGDSTMLGHWRLVLRQAEEAARAGRYDDAAALACRPDVADHHQLVQLRGRLALDLLARAGRRGDADDLAGAVEDLDLADRLGTAPDALAVARLRLADRVASEVRVDLEAGAPGRVVERVEALARHKISGPALRRLLEAAEAWQSGLDEARHGEFGRAHDHLNRAERLAAGTAADALADTRRDVETRQRLVGPKVETLFAALEKSQWAEVLTAAEAVLENVPEHPVARQARTRAWQQIAAIAPSASTLPSRSARLLQTTPRDASLAAVETTSAARLDAPFAPEVAPIVWLGPGPRPAPAAPARALARGADQGPRGRFLLWVDTVGGYLVCLDDRIVLGRAGHDSNADVPLMGDLSRNHATLSRDGDGYILRAHEPTFVNGRAVETIPLHDGDVIRLGATVELEFLQPSPISSTASLAVVSRHRLPLAVEGILLMADTCILGASQAHIPVSGLDDPVILYRQGNALWCRASGAFEVDGRACAARAPLTLQSSVLGEGFSFSLESLGSKSV